MATNYRWTIREPIIEREPLLPHERTTNRPISDEARRIITAAQVEAIRRVRGAQSS